MNMFGGTSSWLVVKGIKSLLKRILVLHSFSHLPLSITTQPNDMCPTTIVLPARTRKHGRNRGVVQKSAKVIHRRRAPHRPDPRQECHHSDGQGKIVRVTVVYPPGHSLGPTQESMVTLYRRVNNEDEAQRLALEVLGDLVPPNSTIERVPSPPWIYLDLVAIAPDDGTGAGGTNGDDWDMTGGEWEEADDDDDDEFAGFEDPDVVDRQRVELISFF